MLTPKLVISPNAKIEFLDFPTRLYQNDPSYIRPLDKDVESIFDPEKNKLFQIGKCERFLFKNTKNETVGRVAVFINPKYKNDFPVGGFGFFDCINDQNTANFIFDFCKNWHLQHGMEAMDGSINFGERDKFWGILIDGFSPPLYGMNYNAPYYKSLFENYGFQAYYHQLCYSRSVHSDISKVFTSAHAIHSKNPNISAKRLRKNNIEQFAKDFTEIYNKAWASHGNGKQIEYPKVLKMFQTMKPIINEHIAWFVYANEQPIAMWINIPDLNQWFKYLDGKFGLWQKIKFLWAKTFIRNRKIIGLVFGIVPEWQKQGIDGYMIWEGTQHIRQYTHFEELEMQWIGDFNPKMIKIAENLDTIITRTLATYRLIFDKNKPFERYKISQ